MSKTLLLLGLTFAFTFLFLCNAFPVEEEDSEDIDESEEETPAPQQNQRSKLAEEVIAAGPRKTKRRRNPRPQPQPRPSPPTSHMSGGSGQTAQPVEPIPNICKEKEVSHNCRTFTCGEPCDQDRSTELADIPCTTASGRQARQIRCCKCHPQGPTVINIYNNSIQQCGANGCTFGEDP